jgi:hypothetical protein
MNPLALSAQAVADATGKVTVRLPAPSLGTWWQAAVVVPTAPTGATLALYLAGSKELSWIGPQPSATVVILPSQVIQVEGSGFTAGQIVSVNVRGGWASGNAQGIAPAGPSSFAMNTFTGKVTAKITGPVTLAAGTSVDITSGTVDLGAGTSVAINAGQLTSTTIPLQATAPQLLATTFGTGETGTVTLSANATLTAVAYYRSLTLDAGVVLTTPWIIFVSATANLGSATSAITNSGSPNSGKTGGAGGLTGSFRGGGAGGNSTSAGHIETASWQGGSGGPGGGTVPLTGGMSTRPLATPILFGTLPAYTFAGGGGGGGQGGTTATDKGGGGGGGVVMLAAKTITGAGDLRCKGGNGTRVNSSNWSGGGGGGIGMVYSHTAKTWTGKVTAAPGVTVTSPKATGYGGSRIVRRKYTGAVFA